MATIEDLNVRIAASVEESGFNRGNAAIAGLATGAQAAAASASAAFEQIGAASDKSAQRITDSAGRVRDGYGKFVTAAQLAAEAAGNVGGSLGGLDDVASRTARTFNGGLVASFAAFDKTIKPLNEGIGRLGESLQNVGGNLTVGLTLPLAATGAAALKVGGDFNAAFNRVAAATQAAGAELDSLRSKAQNIALDPDLKFSSVEAAQALENLAKNGLTTAQILGGAADASTALATATGGNLATAADITTDVMNNFGKSAEQAAGLVDSITGSTIASKFSIDDYKLALGQAGAVAGQLGVDFKDFNTALSVTSSGFSSGSDAGTSFKTFLQRLVPTTKEAAVAMKQLGLNFFDAQGKMLPLRDIAGQLQKAFQGLSDQQKNNLGTQIFGADSIRTALLLAKEGTEGFDKMALAIGKVNAASQGAILNAGFSGALESFKSSAEGLLQAIGDSGLLRFGELILRAGADVAAGLAKIDPAILRAATVVGGLVAAIGPVAYVFGTVAAAIPAVVAGLEVLGLTLSGVLVPLGIGVAAVAAAAYLIIDNWDNLTAYFSASGEGGRIFTDLATSVTNAISQISSAFSGLNSSGDFSDLVSATGILKAAFRDIGVGITAVANVVGGAVGAIVALLNGNLTAAADQASRAFLGLVQPIANVLGFQLRMADASAEARKGFEGAAGGGGVFGDELLRLSGLLPGLERQLQGFAGGFPQYNQGIAAQTGLLEALRQRLEAVKDAREKEATAAAISADNNLIDNLQKQIDALLGVSTKGVTDALTKLRENLRDNGNASRALGADYDYNGQRARILEAGIKSLTDAGFAPGGKVVQDYVRQLREVPKAIDQIAARTVKGSENLFKTPDFELKTPELSGPPLVLQAVDTKPFITSLDEATPRMLQFQQTAEAFSDGLSDVLVGGFSNIAVGFGEAIGQILSGAAGFEALPSIILGAIGQLAIQVGQLAIGVGVAVAGIKTALQSLNPVVAIAGGIALVALGTAVKGVASSIASGGGGGGASASLAGQSATNYGSVNPASQQPLKIIAEFKLRGTDLVAVGRVNGYRELRSN